MSVEQTEHLLYSKQMGSLGEHSEQGEFVFCRLIHFQSLKCLQFWNKMLTRTLAMMKFGRHGSKTEWNYWVWCDAFGGLCDCFFPAAASKFRLQYEWYMCCIVFGRNSLFRYPCPLGIKRKHPSLLMVGVGSDDMTGRNREQYFSRFICCVCWVAF